jgi:hypothetical protein
MKEAPVLTGHGASSRKRFTQMPDDTRSPSPASNHHFTNLGSLVLLALREKREQK